MILWNNYLLFHVKENPIARLKASAPHPPRRWPISNRAFLVKRVLANPCMYIYIKGCIYYNLWQKFKNFWWWVMYIGFFFGMKKKRKNKEKEKKKKGHNEYLQRRRTLFFNSWFCSSSGILVFQHLQRHVLRLRILRQLIRRSLAFVCEKMMMMIHYNINVSIYLI